MIRERLGTEVVTKTDGWQGYSFLDASPSLRHEWLAPGSGKIAPKVLPWIHTLIANIKGDIRAIYHGVSPKHLPRWRNFATVSTAAFGNANVQPDASRLSQLNAHYIFSAKGIIVKSIRSIF